MKTFKKIIIGSIILVLVTLGVTKAVYKIIDYRNFIHFSQSENDNNLFDDYDE